MGKEQSSRRDEAPGSSKQSAFDPSYLDLVEVIHALARNLDASGERLGGPERRTAISPGRWKDSSYCYFELILPERPESEVDINIYDGRAIIRIRR